MRLTEVRKTRLHLEPTNPDERAAFLNATLDEHGARIEVKWERGIAALVFSTSAQLAALESVARTLRHRLAEHEASQITNNTGVPS